MGDLLRSSQKVRLSYILKTTLGLVRSTLHLGAHPHDRRITIRLRKKISGKTVQGQIDLL